MSLGIKTGVAGAVLAAVLAVPPASAQLSRQPDSVSDGLDYGLSSLKDSVQKLTVTNEKLAAQNQLLKQQVDTLLSEKNRLTEQGRRLQDQQTQYQQAVSNRPPEVESLEQQLDDLRQQSTHIASLYEEKLKELQMTQIPSGSLPQRINTLQQEEERVASLPSLAKNEQYQALRTERLKLMKLLADLQDGQKATEADIARLQRQDNGPAQKAEALLDKQNQLRQKLDQLEKGGPLTGSPGDEATLPKPEEIRKVNRDILELDRQYQSLADDLEAAQKHLRARFVRLGDQDDVSKIESSYTALKQENQSLRAHVANLQKDLVAYAKEKAELESGYGGQ